MFKPTRNILFHQLTATNGVQEISFANNPLKTIIDVVVSGAIRLQINDQPASFDASNGILVTYEKPLVLHEHYIEKIKYIRDIGMGSDITFQIIGTY